MTAMQFSIPCNPGDVVLVNFQYTDRPQVKKRPAVVLSVPQYQQSRLDAVMVGLTTDLTRDYFADCPIQEWEAAGPGHLDLDRGRRGAGAATGGHGNRWHHQQPARRSGGTERIARRAVAAGLTVAEKTRGPTVRCRGGL